MPLTLAAERLHGRCQRVESKRAPSPRSLVVSSRITRVIRAARSWVRSKTPGIENSNSMGSRGQHARVSPERWSRSLQRPCSSSSHEVALVAVRGMTEPRHVLALAESGDGSVSKRKGPDLHGRALLHCDESRKCRYARGRRRPKPARPTRPPVSIASVAGSGTGTVASTGPVFPVPPGRVASERMSATKT